MPANDIPRAVSTDLGEVIRSRYQNHAGRECLLVETGGPGDFRGPLSQ